MERGNKVFSPLGVSPSPVPSQVSALGVNDILLHALIVRLALSNDDVVEFRTEYNKETDTVELHIPDSALPYFDQMLGMQRGPNFQTFINWLIGSETLQVGSVLETDPTFVSAGNIIAWSGASAGNLEDKRLVIYLPAGNLSVTGYNTSAAEDFGGGSLRVSLIWVYDSGDENSFDMQTSVELVDIATDTKSSYSETVTISTNNLIHGDIRETPLIDTGDVVEAGNLINIIMRRNYDGSTEPKTDLVGIVGLKVELVENE